MTILGRLLDRERERAVSFQDMWSRGPGDVGPVNHAGVRVNRDSALSLSAVWACVSLISDTISTLPLGAFRRTEDRRVPLDPEPSILETPNSEQDTQQWVAQQLYSLLLADGTAYVMTPRDRLGDVVEAWNIEPDRVTPKRRKGGGVEYQVSDPDRDVYATLDQSQMFHIAGPSWPGALTGISPLGAAMHLIGTGLGAQEFAERYYGQGMHQAGVIAAPGDVTPEQARDVASQFRRAAGGLKRAHLPVVLGGGAEWKPMQVPPDQAQFLESRSFTVNEIARFFRVPPHKISDVERSTSWGNGIEEQGIDFVTYTLLPWLTRLERAYTRHLLLFQPGAFVKFNVNGLMRGDTKTRFDAYGVARNGGWLSADDVRMLEDMPPLPDGLGEEYLRPANTTLAGSPIPEGAPPSTNPQEPPA